MIDWNHGGDERTWQPPREASEREPWMIDADDWRAGAPRDRRHPDAETSDAWRGELHFPEWPEWSAGPEYHMWKRLIERDDEADGTA